MKIGSGDAKTAGGDALLKTTDATGSVVDGLVFDEKVGDGAGKAA